MSSNAGLVSHFVNLQIVIPEATIQGTGSGEHHVDVGSVIDLVCIIEKVRKGPLLGQTACTLSRMFARRLTKEFVGSNLSKEMVFCFFLL